MSSSGTPSGSHHRRADSNDLLDRVAERLVHGVWLVPAIIGGLSVYLAYLGTHEYPAFGAGLFMAMAEEVARQPVPLPRIIDGYTARGVPFAYPPLAFYLVGFLVETVGVPPLSVARHLPNLASLAALVPLYYFSLALFDSRPQAGLATFLAAVAPPLLQWQISAGGIVRAPAYLFTAVGLYAGLRLFRDGRRRWLAPAAVSFALTVLTHPVYTLFFGVSYLWLYAYFDRSLEGLLEGAAVAGAGAVLTAPWWVQVVAYHGPGVLTGAAGTHGGIGTQLVELVSLFTASGNGRTQAVLFAVRPGLFDFGTVGMAVLSGWSLAIVLAGGYMLYAGERRFLPGWFVLSFVLVSKPRFLFLVGCLMASVAFFRGVVPAVVRRVPSSRQAPAIVGVAIVLVLGAATGVGMLYASSNLDSHGGSASLPAFVDDDDVEAMRWVERNTRPDAGFVVLGDTAEWFPYATDRTILVGPWGVEWRGAATYEYQLKLFNELSTCHDARCVTGMLAAEDVRPEYVFVPKGHYTIRGMSHAMPPAMRTSLRASPAYELVYENEGVLVFEYHAQPAHLVTI